MANTRLNPTTSGGLHLGHIYMALVNQYEAQKTGGEFIVRFADNAPWVMDQHGGADQMSKYAVRQLEDLEWMGIYPDQWCFESEWEYQVKEYLVSHPKFHMVIDHAGHGEATRPFVTAFDLVAQMRLSTWITAQKVVLDNWSDCGLIIRGLDLLAEHHLYMYMCAAFGFPFPKCYYLPRLIVATDGKPVNISKTIGNWSIASLRAAGASPEVVHGLLNLSCKRDLLGPWSIDNIKTTPAIERTLEQLL